jgi:hypothetical protein
VRFCNGRKKSSGLFLDRDFRAKRTREFRAFEALAQNLDLAARRRLKQHDVAPDKAVIQQLFGVLTGDIGHKARAPEDFFKRSAFTA